MVSANLIDYDKLVQNNTATIIIVDVNEPEKLGDLLDLKDEEPQEESDLHVETDATNLLSHDEDNNSLVDSESKLVIIDNYPEDQEYVSAVQSCSICSLNFQNPVSFFEHTKKYHIIYENSIFRCPFCEYFSKSKMHVEGHLYVHINAKLYKCRICAKSFQHKAGVQHHMRTHSNYKPFICHLCCGQYKTAGTLASHIAMTHAQVRPFACMDCGLTFGHSSNLRIHMRIHTGERPYKCDVCRKSFVQQGHLQAHSRLHTGERPFKCQYCGSSFTHIGNLRQHEITQHTKNYKHRCNDCNKGFIGPSELKRHQMSCHSTPDEIDTYSQKVSQLITL